MKVNSAIGLIIMALMLLFQSGCASLPSLREPNADKNFAVGASSHISDVFHLSGARSLHIDSPEDKTVTEYEPSGKISKVTSTKTQEEVYSKKTPYFLNGKFTGEYVEEKQSKPSTFELGVKDTQFQQPVTGWAAALKAVPYLAFGWGAGAAFDALKSIGNHPAQVVNTPAAQIVRPEIVHPEVFI